MVVLSEYIYVCNDGILFARSFKLVNFVNKPLHKNKDGADAYNQQHECWNVLLLPSQYYDVIIRTMLYGTCVIVNLCIRVYKLVSRILLVYIRYHVLGGSFCHKS